MKKIANRVKELVEGLGYRVTKEVNNQDSITMIVKDNDIANCKLEIRKDGTIIDFAHFMMCDFFSTACMNLNVLPNEIVADCKIVEENEDIYETHYTLKDFEDFCKQLFAIAE